MLCLKDGYISCSPIRETLPIAPPSDDQPETPETNAYMYATVQRPGSQPPVLHGPGAISGRTPPSASPSRDQPETPATGGQHVPVSALHSDQTAPAVGNRTKVGSSIVLIIGRTYTHACICIKLGTAEIPLDV